MDEVFRFAADRDVLLCLVKDIVTKLAVLGNDLAFGSLVLAIMAAETSRRIEMADIVRIGIPLDFHFREIVPAVNVLHALHSLVDGMQPFPAQLSGSFWRSRPESLWLSLQRPLR